MLKLMLIAGVGGFVGTCGRFLLGRLSSGWFDGSFPAGTFLANITGCLVIGIVFGISEKANLMSQKELVLLTTGFCGGFTTFSAFADDMWRFLSKGEWLQFSLYLFLSIFLGILFVFLGRNLIR